MIIYKDCDKIQDAGTEGGRPFCLHRAVDKRRGKGRKKEVEITEGAWGLEDREKKEVKGATYNFMSTLNMKSPNKREQKSVSTDLLLVVCFGYDR